MKRSFLNSLVYVLGVFVLTFFFVGSTSAQSSGTRNYVKIIVKGVNTSQDARDIDLLIRNQQGVLTSRMDFRTKLYFGVYETSSGLSLNDFKTWLTGLGYEVKCSLEDEHGKGSVIRLKASDCDKKIPVKNSDLQNN